MPIPQCINKCYILFEALLSLLEHLKTLPEKNHRHLLKNPLVIKRLKFLLLYMQKISSKFWEQFVERNQKRYDIWPFLAKSICHYFLSSSFS